ncbi:MAG: aldolase/citrate lyase family protein [Candidatus Poribacteria bacterium]|nr:aldolase/citrate lyase family protein [Candidatus Poribacteria bacterium]
MRNRIREKLERGEVSIGSWLNLGSPLAAEVVVSVGFDWLAVDAEHSPIGISQVAQMFRAIESRGATPIVRVWDHQPETIGRVMDAGAFGIVAPHVSTAEQAAQIAQACRYPPQGKRSSGTGRAVTWGSDYRSWINDEVVVIPQIEDREGIENAEAIVAVEGVDIGFLGPGDLSLDLGIPAGSPDHEDAIQQFLAACKRVGKPCGIPVSSAEELLERQAQGFVFFDLSNDLRFLQVEAERQLRKAQG